MFSLIAPFFHDLRSLICFGSVSRDNYHELHKWLKSLAFWRLLQKTPMWLDQAKLYNFTDRYGIDIKLHDEPKVQSTIEIIKQLHHLFRQNGLHCCMFLYGSNLHVFSAWRDLPFYPRMNIESIDHLRICSDWEQTNMYRIAYTNEFSQFVYDQVVVYPHEMERVLSVVVRSHQWYVTWSFHNLKPSPSFSTWFQRHQSRVAHLLQHTWTPLWFRTETKRFAWFYVGKRHAKLTVSSQPVQRRSSRLTTRTKIIRIMPQQVKAVWKQVQVVQDHSSAPSSIRPIDCATH